MSEWFECKKKQPELGKKVLCHKLGDIYVAMRLENYYIPVIFENHKYSKYLCDPDLWCEIDFPNELTGYFMVAPKGLQGSILNLTECKSLHPDIYWELANKMINFIKNLSDLEGSPS
jgi:hypothetical protein